MHTYMANVPLRTEATPMSVYLSIRDATDCQTALQPEKSSKKEPCWSVSVVVANFRRHRQAVLHLRKVPNVRAIHALYSTKFSFKIPSTAPGLYRATIWEVYLV
ncbi:hypothetical protein CHU98_g4081 [Xylaria longipes]|nr:hypothetical protein CHU98_g4081 [Xylaria longipes]